MPLSAAQPSHGSLFALIGWLARRVGSTQESFRSLQPRFQPWRLDIYSFTHLSFFRPSVLSGPTNTPQSIWRYNLRPRTKLPISTIGPTWSSATSISAVPASLEVSYQPSYTHSCFSHQTDSCKNEHPGSARDRGGGGFGGGSNNNRFNAFNGDRYRPGQDSGSNAFGSMFAFLQHEGNFCAMIPWKWDRVWLKFTDLVQTIVTRRHRLSTWTRMTSRPISLRNGQSIRFRAMAQEEMLHAN